MRMPCPIIHRLQECESIPDLAPLGEHECRRSTTSSGRLKVTLQRIEGTVAPSFILGQENGDPETLAVRERMPSPQRRSQAR